MWGLHSVKLTSNLGRRPEIQLLEGGVGVTKFSLVATEPYKYNVGSG